MIKRAIIIYSSVDGQTAKICRFLSDAIQTNFKVMVKDIADVTSDVIKDSDIIILGASIRYGKHRPNVYGFVKKNKSTLINKKTAFFTVNVVARKKEKDTPETNPYMKKFLEITSWKPNYLAVFAGKIDYPSLSIFDRYIIKFIMWLTSGPTNTRLAYEFTNWKKVNDFAEEIKK